jgi:hypothetical protein
LTTTSDTDGRFHFELPSLHRGSDLTFSAKREDGSRLGFAGSYYPTLKDETKYPFKEPKIVLQPKITMTGKIVDAEGRAVAGATVAATAFSGNWHDTSRAMTAHLYCLSPNGRNVKSVFRTAACQAGRKHGIFPAT